MNGVWHGSTNEVVLMASGSNEGIATVDPLSIREEQRSYESNLWMLPNPNTFTSQPLAVINGKSYSAED